MVWSCAGIQPPKSVFGVELRKREVQVILAGKPLIRATFRC